MAERFADGPRLVVHIGATSASFGLAFVRGRVDWVRKLRCAEYSQCGHAALDYLYMCQCDRVKHVEITMDKKMAHPWSNSIELIRRQLDCESVLLTDPAAAESEKE